MLTVEDITKMILTKALERFSQSCEQYKGQDWEKLKCSDAASLWKDVKSVELELKLMENYVILSKNQKHNNCLNDLHLYQIGLQDDILTLGKLNNNENPAKIDNDICCAGL
ncbi:hypothetical protein Glove_132g37 [Diversispora epigaea]|uniref:Uncharacterized protein n=1 Tax=Diversispora epigaea TaxID=1348612 RepID=A0A397IXJ5_9GLOM|nr:hypothetical protein Glove_132g37 [Diversispora epigaea]